jgi:hypothetical protein
MKTLSISTKIYFVQFLFLVVTLALGGTALLMMDQLRTSEALSTWSA